MGQYICLSVGYHTHRKTLALQRLIGDGAFFLPPRLWAYASVNETEGDFTGYDLETIASVLDIPVPKAAALIAGMRASGFMEAPETGAENPRAPGKLHNWAKWNGWHTRRSEAGRAAANARWRGRGGENGAQTTIPTPSEVENAPPESPPPPNGKAPDCHPGPDSHQPQTRPRIFKSDAGGDSSTSAPLAKEKRTPTQKGLPTLKSSASQRVYHLQTFLETHKGRPESTATFDTPEAKQAAKQDYKDLKKELAFLRETIARGKA